MNRDDQLLTLDEAAALVPGANAATLKRRIRQGRLQAYRPGRHYLTTRADIWAMLEACRVVPKSPPAPKCRPTSAETLELAKAELTRALDKL